MTEFLYEKDLRGMMLNILSSKKHDMTVRALAAKYGFSRQEMRKILMEHCDMIMLENVPTRYDYWDKDSRGDRVTSELGAGLITRAVPLMEDTDMDRILAKVRSAIKAGKPEDEAIMEGKSMIREMIQV